MNWYKKSQQNKFENKYPIAGLVVDNRSVKPEIPNIASIEASLGNNYSILPSIREVPMSDFNINGINYNAQENRYIVELSKEIVESGEISPLIVVIDSGGPYILEGSHRIDALYRLNALSFPALVVIDEEQNSELV